MEIKENRNLKIIVKSLKISIAYIFSISLFFPISTLYPAYKMKQLKGFNNKEWNITTILSICLISLLGVLGYDKDWAFLGFFLFLNIPEFLFRVMIRFTKIKWSIYDVINVSSIITTGVLILLSIYIKEKSGFNIDEIKQSYLSITEISEVDFNMSMNYIEKNRYTIMFIFAYVGNFSIYWAKYRVLFQSWRASYYMLILYIVAYGLGYFYSENIYVTNIKNIITIMYVMNAISAIPKLISEKIGERVSKIIPYILLLTFPKILFVVGAIISFIIYKDRILEMYRDNYDKIENRANYKSTAGGEK